VQADEASVRPAYYAARRGGWRDWWTLLHPPYTAWHLSYVVIGATLAPRVQLTNLIATLLAFFLATGLAAHALDELRGRPLRTAIPAGALVAVVAAGLLGALALGVCGVIRVGWPLIPYLVAGPVLVIAYNAELFGGLMHTDVGFAAAWGAFPLLTAYTAQTGALAAAPVLAAAGAYALSAAQRRLSTPARNIRRRAERVEGCITFADGRTVPVTAEGLLEPLERALRAASWAIMLLAAAMAVARLT
jgi:asparagine N-glycosylation enzyme membrane subunit Stt3